MLAGNVWWSGSVLNDSWLLSTPLHFMSSSLLRPNIFLLLCSKESFIPGQELCTQYDTVAMQRGHSGHLLERAPMFRLPDTMQVGSSRTHIVPPTYGQFIPASFPFYSCLFYIMLELCSPLSSSNMVFLEVSHVESPHPAPFNSMMELHAFLWKQAAAETKVCF